MNITKLFNIMIIAFIANTIFSFSSQAEFGSFDDRQTLNYQLQQKKNAQPIDLDISKSYECQLRMEEDLNSKLISSDTLNSMKADKKLAITLKNDKMASKINSSTNPAQFEQRKRSKAFKEVTVPLNKTNSGKNLNIGLNLDLATQ